MKNKYLEVSFNVICANMRKPEAPVEFIKIKEFVKKKVAKFSLIDKGQNSN